MAKINTEYDVGAAFEAIEEELIASMIRNMERHKVEEIKEDKQWSMWQAEQLKSLEEYRKRNKKKFGKEFKEINKKINRLILGANEDGQMDQEAEILKAIKQGVSAKKASSGQTAEFFKINDRKLNSLLKATSSDMKKAETAVLRRADDQYRKIIFNAQVYVNSGAGTYEKAIDMAAKDFLSAGIDCIEYANGSRHTIADYADMAIRTASKRAYLQGEGTKRQEWGLHLVIMNKRGCPCPKCLPFAGKVMIDDVWSGGSKKDGDYPLMSAAIAAGLYHPRCKDSHTTYFPGISTVDGKYTKKEIADLEETAKREAKQQYANRQEKKFKRLSEYSLDSDNQEQYTSKQKEYSDLSKTLRTDSEYQDSIRKRREEYRKKRMKVAGLDVGTLKEEIASMNQRQDELNNQLTRLREEEKPLERKIYFELSGTQEDIDRSKKLLIRKKEIKEKIADIKSKIQDKQEIYKNNAEKKLVEDGIFEEVKLSKKMPPGTVDALDTAARDLFDKYSIMPKRLVYSPLKVEGATCTYNWLDDTIYLSNDFNDADKYLEKVKKSEQSLIEYNKHHDIKNKAKERIEEAEKVLSDKSVRKYDKEEARVAKVRAEIQLNETRMAVRENLTDCFVHEYGHFIHRHADEYYMLKKKNFGMKELGGSFTNDWRYDINKKYSAKGKIEASKISRYAAENPYETFAEGFLALEKGEEIPQSIEKVIQEAKQRAGAKNIEKAIDSDIIISGARITDIFSDEAEQFANMYYEEIRSFSTDTKKIADNLGKKESDIKKIKRYLFEDDSLLDLDTGKRRRFDPDCAIAQSWQRLMIGKDIKPHDKTLIEHELLEMKIKKEHPDIEHWKAHEKATEKYDYPKEALEYYGNLKKHNKDK